MLAIFTVTFSVYIHGMNPDQLAICCSPVNTILLIPLNKMSHALCLLIAFELNKKIKYHEFQSACS